jgi:WXXGXW repeat (2 copies)
MRFILSIRSLLFALVLLAISAASSAQIGFGVSIRIAPPELPVYEQPMAPGDGYIWTPGYWAYGDDDYYWVPGTWVMAPEVGYLWTPGYWGWYDNGYRFHDGYWGTEVGFYGGINYGYGYGGHGYEGGRWDNGHFYYNQAVSRVNVSINRNVYNTRVNETTVNRVSFNGGNGGVQVRATSREEAEDRGHHIAPVAAQNEHVQSARSNPEQRASSNHGKPPIAATERPGDTRQNGTVGAREGGTVHNASENNNPRPNNEATRPETGSNRPPVENNRPPAAVENTRPAPAVHAKDIPPVEHHAAPNTGNAKNDLRLQQQQQKLETKQAKEQQNLQAKQEKDHQRLPQKPANEPKQQPLEQKHQQQTQQLEQKHTQQQQQLQQHQQPASHTAPPKPQADKPKPS